MKEIIFFVSLLLVVFVANFSQADESVKERLRRARMEENGQKPPEVKGQPESQPQPANSSAETPKPAPSAQEQYEAMVKHIRQGFDYMKEDMSQEAFTEFQMAIDINPNEPQVWSYFIMSCYSAKKVDDCLDYLRDYTQDHPNNAQAYQSAAVLINQKYGTNERGLLESGADLSNLKEYATKAIELFRQQGNLGMDGAQGMQVFLDGIEKQEKQLQSGKPITSRGI